MPGAKRSLRTHRQTGAALLEVIVSATLGSILLVGAMGAWSSLSRWTSDLQRRAVLMREARAAREYLESDLLRHRPIPQATSDHLVLLIEAGDEFKPFGVSGLIEYRRQDDSLLRSTSTGAEMLVAKHLSKIEFHQDPLTHQLTSTLVFEDTLRLRLETHEIDGGEEEEDDEDEDKGKKEKKEKEEKPDKGKGKGGP